MPLDQVTDDQIDDYGKEDNLKSSEMPLIDHLEILRWHLIRSLLAVCVGTIGAFIYGTWVFEHIIFAPARANFWTYQQMCALGKFLGSDGLCINKLNFVLQSRLLTGQFMMHVTASFIIGIIVAFPYIFWEIWAFVKPGLYKKEQKATSGAVFFVSALFFMGTWFGYFVVAPLSINFLASYQISPEIRNEFDIVSYVSTLITLVLGCALLFQLPVLVYFLARVGVITASFMRTYRRHAIIVILVVAGVITPPDIFSQVLISIPLYILYELSIYIAQSIEKQKEKMEKEEEESNQ